MPSLFTIWRLSLLLFLLAGCRSEKVAFQFRPPQASNPQLHSDSLPAPVSVAATKSPELPSKARWAGHKRGPRKIERAVGWKPARKPVAAVRHPPRLLPRQQAAATETQALDDAKKLGFVLMGIGALLLVVVLVGASLVAGTGGLTLEGAILLLIGYYIGVALLIAGVVTLLIYLLSKAFRAK